MTVLPPPPADSLKSRLIELGVGLAIVLAVIAITRVWIDLKNARRADSVALRRSVALTVEAVRRYVPSDSSRRDDLAAWGRFVGLPSGQSLPARPAHEFVDSFVLCYQDGVLDSLETLMLRRLLFAFRPDIRQGEH